MLLSWLEGESTLGEFSCLETGTTWPSAQLGLGLKAALHLLLRFIRGVRRIRLSVDVVLVLSNSWFSSHDWMDAKSYT